MKKVSILVPCFNEARTIEQVLERLSAAPLAGWNKEIIIIDDASTDGTRDILRQYEKTYKILYHDKNAGKGSAVETGLKSATGDYVLIQDADLEYDPVDIQHLLRAVDDGKHDVIYGSRELHHAERKGAYIPRLGVWLMTKEFNLLYSAKLTDIWTCYKLFPRYAAHLFTAGRFESELSFSARLRKNGLTIGETAITYAPRSLAEGKKIRYRDGIKGLWVILKERFI